MATWTMDGPQRLSFTEPVDQLDVDLILGRGNVVATDGPARIEVTRISRVPLTVEHRDGRLTLRHQRMARWPGLLWWLGQLGRRYRVEVSVAVPAAARADIRLVQGTALVSGLREQTSVNVTSGQITLMGLAGQTRARVVSGPVEALGVAGDLSLETVSGELVLADSSAGRVHARTVSGGIICDLDNPRQSEIRLGTVSGGVSVRVREDSDLTVHLRTTAGRITSGFAQLAAVEDLAGGKHGDGVLGTGEGQLWASSTSGSIALLARRVDEDEDGEVMP